MATNSNAVLFRELESVSGKKIAIATLNSEKSLNALNLEMIHLLTPKLKEWQLRDDIAIVMLEGAGEKAFCAGGDVVSLYHAMQQANGELSTQLTEFFSQEYELDYLIHCYKKPFIVWGHGIVMGGGLGLFAGASHKIVTERSRIAMPEITIGLYPDVGGSYFLNKMPEGCGLFLGLTGASINAADAKYVHLANHFVSATEKANVIEAMILANWGSTDAINHDKLTHLLNGIEEQCKAALPQSEIKPLAADIAKCSQHDKLYLVVQDILDLDSSNNPWLAKAQGALRHGSPISANIIWQQLKQAQGMKLADCFRMELGLSVRCGEIGEFQEGVRALLIDKDQKPKWQYHSIRAVPDDVTQAFFKSPWTAQSHPLHALGKTL